MALRYLLPAALIGLAPLQAVDPAPLGLLPVNPVTQVLVDGGAPVDARAVKYEALRAGFEDLADPVATPGNFPAPDFYFDPGGTVTDIVMPYNALARMYYIRESNAFGNSMGFLVDPIGNKNDALAAAGGAGANALIFPLADSPQPMNIIDANLNLDIHDLGFFIVDPTPDVGILQEGVPRPADFVDMGSFNPGERLEFFLIPDGTDAGGNLVRTVDEWSNRNNMMDETAFARDTVAWWVDSASNVDKNDLHAQVLKFTDGPDEYYFIAWEDVPLPLIDGVRSSTDFVDLVTVLQIVPIPEPSSYALMGSFLAIALKNRRRITTS